MKRGFCLFLLLSFLCALLFVSGCTDKQDDLTPDPPVTADTDGTTTLYYEVDENGGGRLQGWRTQHGEPGTEAKVAVTAEPHLGYVFAGWSDGVTEAERHDIFADTDRTITAHFTYDRRELPIMSIVTVSGGDVMSKDTYLGAKISICNTGNASWEMSAAEAAIRGRGNATWGMEKKSYRIRFTNKQQPLGLGTDSDRTWVLMANHCDQSLMRNHLALYLASQLDGIAFNGSSAYVELYLNGEYRGVYLLTEQMQVDAARVDIGAEEEGYDPEAADAGFMVELDSYAQQPWDFYIDDKHYQVKSDVANNAQFEYIKDYIRAVDDAIKEGDRASIEALVDLDSFVDGYLLEEFFKNIDVGWSSFYMYKKPDGKLILGPFWDFDLAAGNDHRLDNGGWEELYVGVKREGFDQRHPWFYRLMRCDWFVDLAAARWAELDGALDATIAELDRLVAEAPESFARNFEKWNIFGRRINQEPEHIMALDSWQTHAETLRTWLCRRRDWLTNHFANT